MKPRPRIETITVASGLTITARRIKSARDEKNEYFWFYVSLHLEQTPQATVALSDLALVDYHLLHPSFPNPTVRIADPANGFEYKFWLYGFIKVSADAFTRDGQVLNLPPTPIAWEVTPEEMTLNGSDVRS